jgi:MazG family protein
MEPSKSFENLLEIVRILRDPERGCPWDKEQTHQSLTPYIIEEAHEMVEAIETNENELPNELGDVLLQVLLHSQIAKDEGNFSIDDVIFKLSEKLIVRHPHVFGDTKAEDSKKVLQNWEQIKQRELKQNKSILDGVPKRMPALLRAQRTGEKAARVGFEWDTLDQIKDKVLEEINEFLEIDPNDKERLEDELGDIYFALTQLSRRLNIDSEKALHRATDKFTRRFQELERRANRPLTDLTLGELDAIWEDIKRDEKRST